ncbi:MAG: nucleotidyltransferase domain-containing protein [Oleispira sp.]|nr:nucleotidyltransferase domain-containing protein [Oleispira sp.]
MNLGIDKHHKLIIDHLSALEGLKLVYLFGSRADASDSKGSDWDIAILCNQALDAKKRWNIAQSLANELGTDVDLIDLLQASTVLQMEVVSKGIRLHGDQAIADIFETKVFSMYSRLQDSRSGIIEKFIGEIKNG